MGMYYTYTWDKNVVDLVCTKKFAFPQFHDIPYQDVFMKVTAQKTCGERCFKDVPKLH